MYRKTSYILFGAFILATGCTETVTYDDDRGDLGKADIYGSCKVALETSETGACGEWAPGTGNCWCDPACHDYGDCCDDKVEYCGCGDGSPVYCRMMERPCPGDQVREVVNNCYGGCADPVTCGPAYDPCEGKDCGDECTICDPADPTCYETEVIKMCNGESQCKAETPLCAINFCDACKGGCVSTGCPDGFTCVVDPNECISSSCGCNEETMSCICTADCGGGSCQPA